MPGRSCRSVCAAKKTSERPILGRSPLGEGRRDGAPRQETPVSPRRALDRRCDQPWERYLLRGCVEKRLHERPGLRPVPLARADGPTDKLTATIDKIDRRRPEHSVEPARDVACRVDQRRDRVAALADDAPDRFDAFTKVDQ